MGFETRDSIALSGAQEKGFDISYYSTTELDHPWEFWLARVVCPLSPHTDDATESLRAIIDAANRLRPRTTVWLDVVDEASLASYVAPAIRELSGYGAFVYVTQGGRSSHPPGEPIDAFVQEAIENMHPGGKMWNPTTDSLVWGSPKLARREIE